MRSQRSTDDEEAVFDSYFGIQKDVIKQRRWQTIERDPKKRGKTKTLEIHTVNAGNALQSVVHQIEHHQKNSVSFAMAFLLLPPVAGEKKTTTTLLIRRN